MLKRYHLKNGKDFLKFLLHLHNLHKSSSTLKKNQLLNLNILEVIDSEKCGYLNVGKLLFTNTLRESTCSPVFNSAKITMAVILK